MRLCLHMRWTTKASTSHMKLPTISGEDGADPWTQMKPHQALIVTVKRSTSVWVAWGRTSTWSWARRQKPWLHLVSPSRSWERMAPRASGPTTRTTSAFTRGHLGRGSTPQWHCPHAWGWWVWVWAASGCRRVCMCGYLLISEHQCH